MKVKYYKKIEYYLYNYPNPELAINEIKEKYTENINISKSTWLKSMKFDSNTMENQIIRMIDSNEILVFRKWQVFLKRTLAFLYDKRPLYYDFIDCKYFKRMNIEDIPKKLNIDNISLKNLRNEVIYYIYVNALIEGLIKDEEV